MQKAGCLWQWSLIVLVSSVALWDYGPDLIDFLHPDGTAADGEAMRSTMMNNRRHHKHQRTTRDRPHHRDTDTGYTGFDDYKRPSTNQEGLATKGQGKSSRPSSAWDERKGFLSCLEPATKEERQEMLNRHRTFQYKHICHNVSCLVEGHKERYLPKHGLLHSKSKKCKEKQRHIAYGNTPPTQIREFVCNGQNYDEAVKKAQDGIRRSIPLVLRRCALTMPAIKKWVDPSHVRKYKVFRALFPDETGDWNEYDVGQYVVPEKLLNDLLPPKESEHSNRFTDFMREFRLKNFVWTSRGARKARTHFGTFPNLHVMISEKKTWWIASPGWSKHLYIDFVNSRCPGDHSGGGDFGCDMFGCYQYIPFRDENFCVSDWPMAKEIKWQTTILSPGDVLLVPAFWFHNVWHHPDTPTGKNIAVTFIRQQRNMPKSRFAEDVINFYRQHVEGNVEVAEEDLIAYGHE